MSPARPTIAISLGDPCGVGPEVTLKALADTDRRKSARFHIYGPAAALHHAAHACGVEPFWWQTSLDHAQGDPGVGAHPVVVIEPPAAGEHRVPLDAARPTAGAGAVSFDSVERAIEAGKRAGPHPLHASAIVTAPINKAAWALAGRGKWPGHTELLASRFGVRRVRMMFVAPELRVMLVTTHVPLMKLRDVVTIGSVHETIDLASEACRSLGVERPRIAVCGLNPHASEGGLFGDEEQRLIEPAIKLAQQQGIDASGPFPADTIFNAARRGRYDLVVAMYHDQGLIPVKLLAFEHAVNMTAGLPVPRTSPDHGTAFDIAYSGRADEGSMAAAIDLAVATTARPVATL